MEWRRHYITSRKESTARRQSSELAPFHKKMNAPPYGASTVPYNLINNSCRSYQECPLQLEAKIRNTYSVPNSLGDVIHEESLFIQPYRRSFIKRRSGKKHDNTFRNFPTKISVQPSYISDSVYNRPQDNYLQNRTSLHCYKLFEDNHPFAENNNQVARNDALSSRCPGELDSNRTTGLLTTLQRQLASRLNCPPSSRQRLHTSRIVTSKTNGNVDTKLPLVRNLENDNIERKVRFKNIDHNPFPSSNRLPYQNINLKCKKELELDVASTLCSLSVIQPKLIDKQNIEIEPSRGESSQSEEIIPTRLSISNDELELNRLHCFVRKELLELFFYKKEEIILAPTFTGSVDNISNEDCNTQKDRSTSPHNDLKTHIFNVSSLTDNDISNDSLRVGFRCVHCAHLHMTSSLVPSENSYTESSALQNTSLRMNAIYPKSISGIYRLVCKWQRVHFKKCKHIPPSVKKMYDHIKASDKSRGKTRYWVSSATQLGLVDDSNPRGGIRYDATKRRSQVQN